MAKKGFQHIHLLLKVKHCTQHEAAKQKFSHVTHLLDKLINIDKEEYAIGYFQRVKAKILHTQKKITNAQKLVDDVHKRQAKCLHNLKALNEIELKAIKRTLVEHQSKLKADKVDFILKTLDGDDTK